jgi:hypothetical protein
MQKTGIALDAIPVFYTYFLSSYSLRLTRSLNQQPPAPHPPPELLDPPELPVLMVGALIVTGIL